MCGVSSEAPVVHTELYYSIAKNNGFLLTVPSLFTVTEHRKHGKPLKRMKYSTVHQTVIIQLSGYIRGGGMARYGKNQDM